MDSFDTCCYRAVYTFLKITKGSGVACLKRECAHKLHDSITQNRCTVIWGKGWDTCLEEYQCTAYVLGISLGLEEKHEQHPSDLDS